MQKAARNGSLVILAVACYSTSRNEWAVAPQASQDQAASAYLINSAFRGLRKRKRYDMDVNIHVHHTIELNSTVVWAFVLLAALLVAAGALYTVLPLYTAQVPEQPKEPFGFQKR
jgi:hypothetical protein